MGVESIAIIVRDVVVLVLHLSAWHKFFKSDRFCVGFNIDTFLKKSDKDIFLERRGRSVNVHVSSFKIQRHHRHDFHVCETGAVIPKAVSFARCILDEILFTRLKRDKRRNNVERDYGRESNGDTAAKSGLPHALRVLCFRVFESQSIGLFAEYVQLTE